MKFLVIETKGDKDFIHFIELRKETFYTEMRDVLQHMNVFNEKITKIYTSTSTIGNW